MKTTLSLIVSLLLLVSAVSAQSIEDGKKMLYYERYQSAKDILDKLVSATPSNNEAIYYLSQAYIGLDKFAEAKAALAKGNANDGMILAGLGELDLHENKVSDAKMKFEVAVSLAKGKNKAILNAIARANVDMKAGDAQYAVDILKPALATENKVAEYFVTLGDAYRKLLDGSNAVVSYQRALEIQPNYAAALYKTGRVFKTQNNKDVFLAKYEDAIKADPNYAPVYYELYYYYYPLNVNTATEYFNKYKPVADQGPALDYEETSLMYASKRFDDAIGRATQLLASEGANADVRLYRLRAYAYFQKGDSANAKTDFDAFFAKVNPEKIVCDNYLTYGKVLAKFRGNEDQASTYYYKAIDCDTSLSNKIDYMRELATMYKVAGNKAKYAENMMKVLSTSKVISKVDLYYTGLATFQLEQYKQTDSLFAIYASRWPDEIYGHYYQALSKWRVDSLMTMSAANPYWYKYIEVAQKDTVANKRGLLTAYNYFVGYNVNIAHKNDSALFYAYKMLALDSANQDAQMYIKELTKPVKKTQNKNSGNNIKKNPALNPKKNIQKSMAKK